MRSFDQETAASRGKEISNGEDFLSLSHPSGQQIVVTPRGASWVSWFIPTGASSAPQLDVILGYDEAMRYGQCAAYLGSTIGRYANRIAGGSLMLPSERVGHPGLMVQLPCNDGRNHLHGGPRGLHQKQWTVFDHVPWVDGTQGALLRLGVESPDGEGGYPGHLYVELTIELMAGGDVSFTYRAVSDRQTVVNLTHHPYFNLGGVHPSREPGCLDNSHPLLGDCLRDHCVMIDADQVAEVDEDLIPVGSLRDVEGSPFDLRQPVSPGERVHAADPQLVQGRGFDHFFVLRERLKPSPQASKATPYPAYFLDSKSRGQAWKEGVESPRDRVHGFSWPPLAGGKAPQGGPQARLVHRSSRLDLQMWTDQPGIQFYTGNWLDGQIVGKGGCRYGRRSGICLEAQNYPDAPHHPQFESPFIRAGEVYQRRIVYRMSRLGK